MQTRIVVGLAGVLLLGGVGWMLSGPAESEEPEPPPERRGRAEREAPREAVRTRRSRPFVPAETEVEATEAPSVQVRIPAAVAEGVPNPSGVPEHASAGQPALTPAEAAGVGRHRIEVAEVRQRRLQAAMLRAEATGQPEVIERQRRVVTMFDERLAEMRAEQEQLEAEAAGQTAQIEQAHEDARERVRLRGAVRTTVLP